MQGTEPLVTLGSLPLTFVPNAGQTDEKVKYYATGAGFGLYCASTEALFAFTQRSPGRDAGGVALCLEFVGCSPDVTIEGGRQTPGKVNYLLGNDPAAWRTGLPTYEEVAYRELWPGVDLVFRHEGGRLKYEFTVQPGARVEDIRLAWHGAGGLELDEACNLLIRTPLGVLTDERPRAYQVVGGRQVPVQTRFVVAPDDAYGFAVPGGYDPGYPLVIDPGLDYSTYLGGSGTGAGLGITVDAAGNAYVTGYTGSPDFPTNPGAFQTGPQGGYDAFVTKLDPAGTGLVYCTYLGGSDIDQGRGIAVDAAGNAYVTGTTASLGFPTTPGAYQTGSQGWFDVFVTKLNPTGTGLVYSTRLGGSSIDQGFGVTVDAAGHAYVTGLTYSLDFPTTPGAYQTGFQGCVDAFVTKLNPAGTGLVYSTYLGGTNLDEGHGITLDAAGNAYVTGLTQSPGFPTTPGAFQTGPQGSGDAFATKLNPAGTGLVYSTYLGGSHSDQGYGIAVDASYSAYVTGETYSSNFPTTPGAFQIGPQGASDAFVTKLNPAGSGLVYSTRLGGSSFDAGHGVTVDAAGDAYVTGDTYSRGFPTTPGAFQTVLQGHSNAFVTELNRFGSGLRYSTYLGGSGNDVGRGIALGAPGNAYVTGHTNSPDFPTTPGAFQTGPQGSADAFVARVAPDPPPAPSPAPFTMVARAWGRKFGL